MDRMREQSPNPPASISTLNQQSLGASQEMQVGLVTGPVQRRFRAGLSPTEKVVRPIGDIAAKPNKCGSAPDTSKLR